MSTKANGKFFILVRHMKQKEIPGDKSFWGDMAELDPNEETFEKTGTMINHFLTANNLKPKGMTSSSFIRAIQTAQGIRGKFGLNNSSHAPSPDNPLNPLIGPWETLMRHFPASIEGTVAMYHSEAKGILMVEGHRLSKYIKDSIKRLELGMAEIHVTHSPVIEAVESTFLKQWVTAPKTIAKGEAIVLAFNENNEFVRIIRLELPA